MKKLTLTPSPEARTVGEPPLHKSLPNYYFFPMSFDAELHDDGDASCCAFSVILAAAGTSSLIYVSTNPDFNYALKFNDKEKETNDWQYLSSVALPSYLIPRVHCLTHLAILDKPVSVFVVDLMKGPTIKGLLKWLIALPCNNTTLTRYFRMIDSVFCLMIDAAVGDELFLGDWTEGLMFASWADDAALKLVDWAGTVARPTATAYQRMRMARKSFIRTLPMLDTVTDRNAESDWFAVFEDVMKRIITWWPAGGFPDSMNGVPNKSDVKILITQLFVAYGEVQSDELGSV